MKTKNKFRYISIIMTLLIVVYAVEPRRSFAASQPTINLGTTSTFAVLAGSTITNTGTTIINGEAGADIGLSPGTAFTGQASVSVSGGAIHLADATAVQAKTDLITAYNDADSRLPITRIPSELGGTTLTPGTYDSEDGKFQITGILTLDAQGDPEGVFVFKTVSTLITAVASSITLTNSARFCRTFWKVGSSATLGANSTFVGHIFAMASITANNGAFINGQLLARTGAVTLDNNIITNGFCAVVLIPTPTPIPESTSVPTPTSIPTDASTPTPIPESTSVPTPTSIPMVSSTPTPIPESTSVPTPTSIPMVSSTPTPIPVSTPVPTPTSIPTVSSTPTPIPESTSVPTPTSIPMVSSTPTPIPVSTLVPTPTPMIIDLPIVTPIPGDVLPEEDVPKTGSFPTEVLYGMGTLLSWAALLVKKKKH